MSEDPFGDDAAQVEAIVLALVEPMVAEKSLGAVLAGLLNAAIHISVRANRAFAPTALTQGAQALISAANGLLFTSALEQFVPAGRPN